jgi:A/G-specific adenine glycosylase
MERVLPLAKERPARSALTLACAAVIGPRGILLARREARGLFGGLWELPCAEVVGDGDAAEALAALGLVVTGPVELAVLRRSLTHRELSLRVFRCRAGRKALPGYVEQAFVRGEDLGALGISTAMVRALEAIEGLARTNTGRKAVRRLRAGGD